MKKAGRILLFTGEGKGKTTAALGTAVRASGHGMKVLILQFIKRTKKTGELAACAHLPGVEIKQAGKGFLPESTNPVFPEHCRKAEEGLDLAAAALESGQYDMVVLDEICTAVSKGLLTEDSVAKVLHKRHRNTHVVMTGRNATPGLINLADTVTEMRQVKHCFLEGRGAQKGVEY